MARNRLGDVIARIQRRTIQGFNQPYLVFVNHRSVEEPDREQSGFGVGAAFERTGLSQDAIGAGGENVYLRPRWPPEETNSSAF